MADDQQNVLYSHFMQQMQYLDRIFELEQRLNGLPDISTENEENLTSFIRIAENIYKTINVEDYAAFITRIRSSDKFWKVICNSTSIQLYYD